MPDEHTYNWILFQMNEWQVNQKTGLVQLCNETSFN